MSYLLELCLPYLLTREQYLERLDSVLTSSEDIQTMEDAQAYWRKHFRGKTKAVQIHYKARQYAIKIDFVTDHAYSKKNPDWEEGISNIKRVLDSPRAQALDNIWKVLQNPNIITWSKTTTTNKQYDAVLSAENRVYGRVVLAPTPTAQDLDNDECTHFEFVSWHLPSDTQYKWATGFESSKTTPVQLPPSMRKKKR